MSESKKKAEELSEYEKHLQFIQTVIDTKKRLNCSTLELLSMDYQNEIRLTELNKM